MLETIRRDIQSVMQRDPAARNALEILLCYPGLHALWAHRLTHWLWQQDLKLVARFFSQLARGVTGIEIHPGAQIGSGFFIDHGMGVVIGETAQVGNNVTLYHGVTLGGTSLNKGKRHPTLGNNVVVGAGAKILGAITVGDDTRVGANAVVVRSVPSNSVVVGVPGQAVRRSETQIHRDTPDLEHTMMPDMIGASVISLMARMDALEQRILGRHSDIGDHPVGMHSPQIPEKGLWHGEDFSI